jgi:hypothetical protein
LQFIAFELNVRWRGGRRDVQIFMAKLSREMWGMNEVSIDLCMWYEGLKVVAERTGSLTEFDGFL